MKQISREEKGDKNISESCFKDGQLLEGEGPGVTLVLGVLLRFQVIGLFTFRSEQRSQRGEEPSVGPK